MIGDRNRRPTGPEYAVRERERGYYAQSLLASGLQLHVQQSASKVFTCTEVQMIIIIIIISKDINTA